MSKLIRTYSELMQLKTFEERFEYLSLKGKVFEETFGFDRYLNQIFYRSPEWQRLRRDIIIRDDACDLGISDRHVPKKVIVHHMNPISLKDINDRESYILNPEYLICTSLNTHNAIHYGDMGLLIPSKEIERRPGDTCPWR